MSGHQDEHEQLEHALAEHVNKEAAILFNFGYPGVVSSIDAILSRKDVVIYDEESHACIIDGVRLHLGKRMAFKHNDIAHLEKQLIRAQEIVAQTGGGILVISEGVFSMRGDQGRLKEIAALKPKYGFRFFIDDAHGFGVLGTNGAGTAAAQGVQDDIDFYFATFAKAMATVGGFLAAKAHVVKYLYYNARSQVYAKSLPMIITLGALKRLELLQQEHGLRAQVWAQATKLRTGLQALGLSVGGGESPITPVYLPCSVEEAAQVVLDLRERHHIFCSGVMYPVVPKGVILFRLVATARHSDADIEQTIDAFRVMANRLKKGFYSQHTVDQ
jgi:glycine C-acetyltransferase